MKDHYDICVTGFWYGYNYGSLLNGYAEYRLLKDMGKEVLMLQKPGAAKDDPEITSGHNTRFVKKYYDEDNVSPILPYSQLEELNEVCDCFCAGSDQVWNYALSFNENMYLPFAHDDKRIISFASSFGHRKDNTPSEARSRVQSYLRRFNAISVREKFDTEILADNYGINGTLVFEPVFCLDEEIYENLAAESTFEENQPYIAAYILDPTPEKRNAILYYAKASGKKAVIILDGAEQVWERNRKIMNLSDTLENVGVEDFLKVFMNASFIITDSFHGTAFSIIFNKPFLSIGNYTRGIERFRDLCERLRTSDRLVTDPEYIPLEEKYLQPINYEEINQIIIEEKHRTIEWLKWAIETPIEQFHSLLYVPEFQDKPIRRFIDENGLRITNNIFDYFNKLKNLNNAVIIISVKDTAGLYFNDALQKGMSLLGLKENLINKFRVGYISIIKNGEIVFEEITESSEALNFEGEIEDMEVSISSIPFGSGNEAAISIDRIDYAVNQRGLNIVVFDLKKHYMIDSVAFDTHVPELTCYRKTNYLKNHYDIGVVGVWNGANYGSLLNGFAVYKILKKLNLSVLMIRTTKYTAPRNGFNEKHNDRFLEMFYPEEDYSPIIPFSQLNLLNKFCDTFLSGSDQIWNYGINQKFDMLFMLNFVDDEKRKLSFSTSFGHGKDFTPKDMHDRTKELLQRYQAISIREKFGVEICQKNYGLNAKLVIEPVFCLSAEEYNTIADRSNIQIPSTPYILTYILDPTEEKRQTILGYMSISGMGIRNILDGAPQLYDENKSKLNLPNTMGNIGAEDFLNLYRHASFVITDSFHGTAFALIFNKPFLSIANPRRGSIRFKELLGKYGLLDRLAEKPQNIPINKSNLERIDYTNINDLIAKEKEDSIEWLRKAIETPIADLPSIELPKKAVTSVLDNSLCTGCGLCVNICPTGALHMQENEEGFLNPSIDYEKCVDCGACEKNCIMLHPQYKNSDSPECFALWAADDIRKVSSSGGAFTLAADYVLSHNGYVCGAAYKDDYSVEHIIISNKDELYRLRGSKYIQSRVDKVYPKIKELLDEGELVLFTGLPCQVAGIKTFLEKEYENLYTMDLVCHGITSTKVFNKYVKDVHHGKQIVDLQFKAKEPWGWHAGVNAKFSDGSSYAEPLEKDPYYRAYLSSTSKNRACGVCVCNKLPRQADITIGDFWGIGKYDKELNDGKGTSEVLVNNLHGQDLMNQIQNSSKMCKEVPLHFALDGNPVMKNPYKMNRNRDYFFQHLEETDFTELTSACVNNDFRTIDNRVLEGVNPSFHGLYYLAKIVSNYYGGRKIVTWGNGPIFCRILKKYFGLEPEFNVTSNPQSVNDNNQIINVLKGKSDEYYVVNLGKAYATEDKKRFDEYGYKEIEDYVYRIPKPIVLENYDLKSGNYTDIYGNSIIGVNGNIKKVVFRGFNNHINIGKDVVSTNNLDFDLSTNNVVEIGDNCRFHALTKFEMFGQGVVSAHVRIENHCSFRDSLFRLYGHEHTSSILINQFSTFEDNLCLHANQGKRIIIGRDCMFSRNINVWAGDGHSMFDVNTGENTNAIYDNLPADKRQVVLGNHVWVSKNAFIMHGTNIGSGSVIGAQCVVKGKFPNNCVIAGDPARITKTDTAWSRDMETNDIRRCGAPEYAVLTSHAKSAIAGLNVLVIGGTRFMGIKLVQELLEKGNQVTIATRGNAKDSFGDRVKRIHMDISKAESVRQALDGKYYDVVFDNLAYCSNYVRNILSVVNCGRYIQISSIATYYPAKGYINEKEFNPYNYPLKWEDQNENYASGKRQAEAAIYQEFSQLSAVTVRIPYVTKTDRLFYYCKNIVNTTPMNIVDVNRGLTFVRDEEVGKFLPWIAAQDYSGPINLASKGFITISQIFDYVEKKTGGKAIIDPKAEEKAPFNDPKEGTFELDMSVAEQLGYYPSELKDWFWELMDEYIARALKEKK